MQSRLDKQFLSCEGAGAADLGKKMYYIFVEFKNVNRFVHQLELLLEEGRPLVEEGKG